LICFRKEATCWERRDDWYVKIPNLVSFGLLNSDIQSVNQSGDRAP